jgi:hypothetical protein
MLANIRLGWKKLATTNTLAYYDTVFFINIKNVTVKPHKGLLLSRLESCLKILG